MTFRNEFGWVNDCGRVKKIENLRQLKGYDYDMNVMHEFLKCPDPCEEGHIRFTILPFIAL